MHQASVFCLLLLLLFLLLLCFCVVVFKFLFIFIGNTEGESGTIKKGPLPAGRHPNPIHDAVLAFSTTSTSS